MRIWKWLALALLCCLAAALGYCYQGRKDGKPHDGVEPVGSGSNQAGSGAGDAADHKKQCTAKHRPVPRSVASLTGDCPSTGCGLNGSWLGSGVPFRTLHLSPFRHNETNLSIVDFQNPAKEHLTIQVDGDILRGKPVNSAAATDVVPGSVLYLGPPETPGGPPSKPTYMLTITGINPDQPFWADCPGCTNPHFPTYNFTATSIADNCEVAFCQPGLSTDDQGKVNNLSGTAVIFRGDYYDDAYTVRTTPPSDYDDDVFNIACLGTAISKLHRFRHTSAARVTSSDLPPSPLPSASQRQALLRLLTADYCGIGHPFTVDGTPIRLGFNQTFTPTSHSEFTLNSSGSIDALWTGGGATCIGTPRLTASAPAILDRIQATCREAGHPILDCRSTAPLLVPPFAPPFPMGSYAISQNP
jgi:hypothetical protein